jgi:hypothetical protein
MGLLDALGSTIKFIGILPNAPLNVSLLVVTLKVTCQKARSQSPCPQLEHTFDRTNYLFAFFCHCSELAPVVIRTFSQPAPLAFVPTDYKAAASGNSGWRAYRAALTKKARDTAPRGQLNWVL